MTDSAPAGSVQADASAAGTLAQPPAGADNGSAPPADATNFSGLSEGTRKWVDTKGLKSHEDIAAAAMNAEQKIGSMFSLPAEDAPPEEWQEKVFARLPEAMRPVTAADKIEYKRPEGLPADLPYSDELAAQSKQWAVKRQLSPAQAQGVHDDYVTYIAEQMKAQQAQVAKSVEDTHEVLVKDWGPMESEGFKTKHELANRGLKKLGLVESAKAKGILLPDGVLTDPQWAKAFAVIGESMFRDDPIDTTGGAPGGENPFKRDAQGEIKSLSAISALIKNDPPRAKRLAEEAGEVYSVWVPNNPR